MFWFLQMVQVFYRGYIVFNRSTGTLASPTAVGLNYWLGGLVMEDMMELHFNMCRYGGIC
jgi:hypothetical protein